jgi:glycosyltransferase involved in cell wall biosynthesis
MDKPVKSELEQVQFFQACQHKFQEAAAKSGQIKCFYDVAGTKVCLLFAGESMLSYMTPALAHLSTEETDAPDVTFCIWDSDSTGVEMPPPPCEWSCFTNRGDIWGFNSQRIKTAFHWGEFSVNVMDLENRTGIFWVQSGKKLPYWTLAAPLRTLFHWWMEHNNMQLLHAAAVGTKDGAVLITGKGGIGKSTTAVNCLQQKMFYLADDYLIVKAAPDPVVYSLYATAKLNSGEESNFPLLLPYAKNADNQKNDKTVFCLYPGCSEFIVKSMPLKAILMPQISDEAECSISAVPYWTIEGAMSFTTMSQLPNVGRHTHDFICKLCNDLPGFLLQLGKNPAEVPGHISRFLGSLPEVQLKDKITTKNIADPQSQPLISIVIPVYNGAGFIKEAVDNILSQNYPAIEIIFINDGSTDNSEEIIRSLDIDYRYFYQDNDGPASARNRGIKEASAGLITFLDVDDLWPANNLWLLSGKMQQNTDVEVVHGFAQLLEKNSITGNYDFTGNPQDSFPAYIGAGIYRKSVFSMVGLFDSFMKFGEDADWFKRAGEMNINLKKLEEVTLYVRRHGKNMTEGKNLVELNALKVFKKSLDRMRGKPESKTESISVIIPVFNGEAYLAEAIESVLNQHLKVAEIIVVDDGSTDNSVSVARKYQPDVILFQQQNKGAAAARNLGVTKAKGNYLAFLDADDIWTDNHLSLLLDKMKNDPALDMVFGKVEQFISPELDIEEHERLKPGLKVIAGEHPGAMLIKRSSFMKVGLLNENLQLAEFIDWFGKARDMGLKSGMLEEIVYKRRIHRTNQGILKRDLLKDYTKVLREVVGRKRK